MNAITAEQLYEQHIKLMSTQEKLRLMTIITQQLVKEPALIETVESPDHSIMELQDPGADIRQDIDAQEYVDELSEEQKSSPQAILKLAGTLSAEEAEAILQAAQECRRIDWEMWEQVG